eukprot:m51a1_g2953 hypothetical protein (949) ;mRNA; r:644651-649202
MSRFSRARMELENSAWFADARGKMLSLVLGGSRPPVGDVVCYGIGNACCSRPCLYQFAFLSLLPKALSARGSLHVYDPMMSPLSKSLAESFGATVLDANERGCRQVDGACEQQTVFFMPHCGKGLYCNVLNANWDARRIPRIALIGNSFESYSRRSLGKPKTIIDKLAPLVVEEALLEKEGLDTAPAFNDTAVHVVPASALASLPESWWSDECASRADAAPYQLVPVADATAAANATLCAASAESYRSGAFAQMVVSAVVPRAVGSVCLMVAAAGSTAVPVHVAVSLAAVAVDGPRRMLVPGAELGRVQATLSATPSANRSDFDSHWFSLAAGSPGIVAWSRGVFVVVSYWSCGDVLFGAGVYTDGSAGLDGQLALYRSAASGAWATTQGATSLLGFVRSFAVRWTASAFYGVPPTWTCNASAYNDTECDCGCGAWDPACASNPRSRRCSSPTAVCSQAGQCEGTSIGWRSSCSVASYWAYDTCNCECGGKTDPDCYNPYSTSTCEAQFSPYCLVANETSASCQDRWTCNNVRYRDGIVCNCGCGIQDPDCDTLVPTPTSTTCSANLYRCIRGKCAVPKTWTCPSYNFGTRDGCHCGCGAYDLDCDYPGQVLYGCNSSSLACSYDGRCIARVRRRGEECDGGDTCDNCSCKAGYAPSTTVNGTCDRLHAAGSPDNTGTIVGAAVGGGVGLLLVVSGVTVATVAFFRVYVPAALAGPGLNSHPLLSSRHKRRKDAAAAAAAASRAMPQSGSDKSNSAEQSTAMQYLSTKAYYQSTELLPQSACQVPQGVIAPPFAIPNGACFMPYAAASPGSGPGPSPEIPLRVLSDGTQGADYASLPTSGSGNAMGATPSTGFLMPNGEPFQIDPAFYLQAQGQFQAAVPPPPLPPQVALSGMPSLLSPSLGAFSNPMSAAPPYMSEYETDSDSVALYTAVQEQSVIVAPSMRHAGGQ